MQRVRAAPAIVTNDEDAGFSEHHGEGIAASPSTRPYCEYDAPRLVALSIRHSSRGKRISRRTAST
jgi:hypothetical protein